MSSSAPVSAYRILAKIRAGERLSDSELAAVSSGAADGSWSDAQLAAFLMGAAIRELDPSETAALTEAMLDSGERWNLGRDVVGLGDKHSTGGVGDKVSLVLAPLLAALDRPIVMLTGRGLGHTGGTADKLECIPDLDLALDRKRSLELLEGQGMAIGIATTAIAPADRRLYALRDQTATVDSLPLIVASILSKKLATGASGIVFDVKMGEGAFLTDPELARALASRLTGTASDMGTASSAVLTDMSQPLGDWVGHNAEVREVLDCLEGDGPAETMKVTTELAVELSALTGERLDAASLDRTITSGAARQRFEQWAIAQGARAGWWRELELPLAPTEVVIEAPADGFLSRVATRDLGLLLAEAGGGRIQAADTIDAGIALKYEARIGQRLEAGQEIARLYLRSPDEALAARARDCFTLSREPEEPPRLVAETVRAADSG
ncbi:MAG TPA: thymidine phosphorylase [Thermoanaerobaculia bacterium]|nr:thymidine phosphorylase [Thermoanaerobaculia bacterium]